MRDRGKLTAAVAVAAVLWFFMFSPWTGGLVNFWLAMTASACILTGMTLILTKADLSGLKCGKPALQLLLGIILAFALWGVFWVGDKLSSLMFGFARPQVDAVYSMKHGLPVWVIALLLLFVIGPAEEFFWRGFVQRKVGEAVSSWKFPADHAFLITTLVYGLIHIWSMNFMLVMAALVAGAVWGWLYRMNPRLLPALIVSHALWDVLVFIVFPI